MAKTVLAIDFGSSYTSIYKKQVGLVLKEPTLVATSEYMDTYKIVELGQSAKKMLGKTNSEVKFVSPVFAGLITNLSLAEELLTCFLAKVLFKNEKFDIVFTVPCGLTDEEILNFKNLGLKLGAGKVHLVPSVLTALLGSNVNIDKASGILSLNLGAGTIDMAICSLSTILKGYSLGFGGNKIDEAIKLYAEQFLDM